MAVTSLIPPKPLETKEANSLFKKSSKSLNQTQKNVVNINKLLNNRIKVRKQIFSEIIETKRRREFDTRRMETEDERESRKSIPSGIGNIAASASKTGGSLIGRLLKALGFIAAGWILRTLPTWIGYAKEFIARLNEIGRIIKSFATNVGNILQSSFRVLKSLKENILEFDFLDSERKLRGSFDELRNSIEGLQKDFKDTIDVFTTDLTKEIDGVRVGSYSEEAIPEPGQGFTEDASSQTQTYDSGSSSSGSSSGGGRWKPILDLIASGESTTSGGYDAMYPGRNTRKEGKPVSEMTITEAAKYAGDRFDGKGNYAVGRYQFTTVMSQAKSAGLNPDKDLFSPTNQDKMAVTIIEGKRRGKDWLSGKITDEQFGVLLANEWAALKRPSGAGSYDGDGRNQANTEWRSVKSALSQVKSGSSQTSQPQTSQPQKAISTPSTTLTGGEYFKPLPQGSFKGGAGQVFGAGREGRSHLGIDITESNWKPGSDPRIPVVAIRGGIVISDSYNPNPSSYTAGVMIRQDDGYDVRYLHMSPSVKPGDKIQSGQQIGRLIPLNGRSVGMPGNDTHLHLELYKGSQLLDPTSYIRSIESGARPKTQITPTPTPSLAQVTAPPSQQRQQISQQITPERKAQDIVAVVPQSSPQQPATSQGSAPPQQQAQPSMGELLNNFIKQKFLLDLSFL